MKVEYRFTIVDGGFAQQIKDHAVMAYAEIKETNKRCGRATTPAPPKSFTATAGLDAYDMICLESDALDDGIYGMRAAPAAVITRSWDLPRSLVIVEFTNC